MGMTSLQTDILVETQNLQIPPKKSGGNVRFLFQEGGEVCLCTCNETRKNTPLPATPSTSR